LETASSIKAVRERGILLAAFSVVRRFSAANPFSIANDAQQAAVQGATAQSCHQLTIHGAWTETTGAHEERAACQERHETRDSVLRATLAWLLLDLGAGNQPLFPVHP